MSTLITGFRVLVARELEQEGRKESLQKLQKMVFPSIEKEKAGYRTFREQYRSYKENYVRSLSFDPEDPNLSQLFSSTPTKTFLFQPQS